MDFNFDTGAIYGGLQSLDVTTLPPLGGQAGVLTIYGDGALTLPQGATGAQPAVPAAGMFRYNTGGYLEFYDSTTWQQLSYAAGSVSSVSLNDNSATAIYTTSPISGTTGAVAATMTLNSQAANKVFAGPTTGSAQPSFRSLVTADMPAVTNLAGGLAGNIVYQSAPDTTAFLANGTSGYVLTSNGAGNAPSYTQVVSSFSTGTTGLSVNAATGDLTLSGTLVVANGGTGLSTITSNGVVFGNGASAAGVTAAGAQYNVLTVDALGVPTFGQVNLAQSAAVSGVLNLANGGTNSNLSGSNGSIVYNNGTSLVNSTVGSLNQALLSSGAGAPTWQTVSATVTTDQIIQGNGSGAFTANGATFIGSGSYSGVTLSGTVTNSTDAVTKAYADSLVAGLSWKQAVTASTTAPIVIAAPVSALFDGVTVTSGERVLVKNQATQTENGIYIFNGTLSPMTRTTDTNTGAELQGAAVFVEQGTTLNNTAWIQTTDPVTLGTSNIVWAQFSGQGTYLAGSGLTLSGNTFSANTDASTTYVNGSNQVAVLSSGVLEQVLLSQGTGNTASWGALPLNNSNAVTGTLAIGNGGTGLNTTPTDGQLLIGNGTSYSLTSLTAGSGISVTNGSGTITISNTGVLSFSTGTTGLSVNAATGDLTLSGTLVVANGGTGVTSLTSNGVMYGGATVGVTAAGATGQVLVGNTGSAPSWAALSSIGVTSFQTSLSGLTPSTATNGVVTLAGTLGIASGGTGQTTAITAFDALSPLTTAGDTLYYNGTHNARLAIGTTGQILTVVAGVPGWTTISTEAVTSFSGGTTGLTPNSPTTGDVVLAGSLNIVNGGTGLTSLGSGNQVFGMNAAGTAAEYKTLTAGTGMSVDTTTPGVVTFNNTGVTSVALVDGSTSPIYGITGSPVTTTGSLTFSLNTQTTNKVFAAPNGSTGQPTFRALAYADLPLKLYVESPVTPVAPVVTADNGVAIGSGAKASLYGQKAYANGVFANPGDAQHGVYVLRNVTTDATLTELFLDGVAATQRIVMPIDSVFTFDILVAGRRTDVTGGGAGYRFVGVARKDATSASITFIGTPSKTVLGETNVAWDAAVSVDTTNGSFRVRVTGEAAKTISWVATVMTTEVTN